MNTALSTLYNEGFFIRSAKAIKLAKLIVLFLQKYVLAAALCIDRSRVRFAVTAKVHMLHHPAHRMWQEGIAGPWARNPLSESVQMQEDFIGRPSRLSRRVSARLMALRVMQRSLIASMQALQRSDSDSRGLDTL